MNTTWTTQSSIYRRFWGRVIRDSHNCWLWVGQTQQPGGYGYIRIQGKNKLAHRFAYEELIGPIPAGLQIDHLCRQPNCVNPAHLDVVTIRENVLRGVGFAAENALKKACPQGHEYTPDNMYRYNGHRACKTCVNNRAKAAWRKKADSLGLPRRIKRAQ